MECFMECPHKTWKPNDCVCDLESAEVGKKILWYTVDTPSQKWATAACRRSWFQDSHTHTHTHTHTHELHSQWYFVFPCNNIKTVTPVSPVLCEERFLFLHIGFADLSVNSVEPSCIPFECVCVCVSLWPLAPPLYCEEKRWTSSWASVLKQTEPKRPSPPNPSFSLSPPLSLTWDSERAACGAGGRVALVEFVSVGFWERFTVVMAQVRNSTRWNVCRCIQLNFIFAVCGSMRVCVCCPVGFGCCVSELMIMIEFCVLVEFFVDLFIWTLVFNVTVHWSVSWRSQMSSGVFCVTQLTVIYRQQGFVLNAKALMIFAVLSFQWVLLEVDKHLNCKKWKCAVVIYFHLKLLTVYM